MTPLFESWLLTILEERLHAQLQAWTGQAAPRPHHVVVNGWYFYSLNWLSPRASIRNIPSYLAHVIREPRRVAAMFPPLGPPRDRPVRTRMAHRAAAAVSGAGRRSGRGRRRCSDRGVADVGRRAGRAGGRVLRVARRARRRRLQDGDEPRAGLPARTSRRAWVAAICRSLAGFDVPLPARAALVSLDWWFPAMAVPASAAPDRSEHERVVAERRLAEAAASAALAASPQTPPVVPAVARRDPTAHPDPRGAGPGADHRVAGDAPRGPAHR